MVFHANGPYRIDAGAGDDELTMGTTRHPVALRSSGWDRVATC